VARRLGAVAPGALPEVPDGGEPGGGEAPSATPPAALAGAPFAAGAAAATPEAPTAAPPPAATGPSGTDRPPAPPPVSRPAGGGPPREPAAPPSSRLGGMVLVGGVLAVVVIVVVFAVRGGSGGEEPAATAVAPTATPTPAATGNPARITDRIPLRAVAGSQATGRMTVFLQNKRLLFQLRARNVPPNGKRSAYAVWFTGPGARARRLGYTNPVGADGRLGIQGPSDKDLEVFPRLYATYTYVVVSRETERNAPRPAEPVLRGLLPAGR